MAAMSKEAPIVLWDIDGTLLAAGDGGITHFHKAVTNVSGKKELPSLVTHGKTDWQIIREILEEAQLDLELAAKVSEELAAYRTSTSPRHGLLYYPASMRS